MWLAKAWCRTKYSSPRGEALWLLLSWRGHRWFKDAPTLNFIDLLAWTLPQIWVCPLAVSVFLCLWMLIQIETEKKIKKRKLISIRMLATSANAVMVCSSILVESPVLPRQFSSTRRTNTQLNLIFFCLSTEEELCWLALPLEWSHP